MRRAEILEALTALGEELSRRGVTAGMYVVGGAAIALAYDERRSTRDVDDVFAPTAEVYRAAARVAAERGLPEGWVNDAVKGFLLGPDPFDTEILEVPGNVLTLLDRMAPARLLTAQVRFFVEAVLDPD